MPGPGAGFPPPARPAHPSGPLPTHPAGRGEHGPAGAEWTRLLRSLLPQPVKRRWSREFVNGLEFRGWGIRVAIPILAMVVFGVAVVVIADANSGHAGPTPSAASLGFPPGTLAPGNGMPLRRGDRVNAVARTAHGFIAVGASVPGGDAARSTPLIFLSANGTSWERLDAARLRLAAGNGHALDITSVAAAGKLILISGDAVTTKPRRTATVQAGPVIGTAWLSADGGATWAPVSGAATGHGAHPQVAGVAAAGHGFVLLRPATVARR